MSDEDRDVREADELYERYARPLEAEHMGEYVALSYDGRLIFGKELYDLVVKASSTFGSKNHVFKVGERAVGKWL
jgi:hypothetical protein